MFRTWTRKSSVFRVFRIPMRMNIVWTYVHFTYPYHGYVTNKTNPDIGTRNNHVLSRILYNGVYNGIPISLELFEMLAA